MHRDNRYFGRKCFKNKVGKDAKLKFEIKKLKSGPLGGDQQLGALIAEGRVDIIFFLWDPMEPHPHDVDVKALLRIAVLYNVPTACNRATADFMVSSKFFNEKYEAVTKDYSDYTKEVLISNDVIFYSNFYLIIKRGCLKKSKNVILNSFQHLFIFTIKGFRFRIKSGMTVLRQLLIVHFIHRGGLF